MDSSGPGPSVWGDAAAVGATLTQTHTNKIVKGVDYKCVTFLHVYFMNSIYNSVTGYTHKKKLSKTDFINIIRYHYKMQTEVLGPKLAYNFHWTFPGANIFA